MVRYVLEGSVRRLDKQVQINVQLIDAESGAHVWTDKFDTERSNIAKAQIEVTGRLARPLQIELYELVGRRIEQERPDNLDARDLVMLGWAPYFRPQTEASLAEAQRAFEKALQLDPNSVDARGGLAQVIGEYLVTGRSKSREQDMARSKQLISEGLGRDRNNSKLLYALGRLRRLQGRLEDAKDAFQSTIIRDGNNTAVTLQLGITLMFLGHPELALPHLEKALRLNSQWQNLYFNYWWLGLCHLLQGEPDEAPGFPTKARLAGAASRRYLQLALAAVRGLKGDVDEAATALREAQNRGDLRR